MPLTIPTIDNRTYQELLDSALARIPVHTPEWTNFNRSDPGVTLIEVFAFLTESLLYRANQIPERNRRKFLSLLGVPLQPASSARGIVAFTNNSVTTITLNHGLELLAGNVPFRTEQGLDVLPIEAPIYFKRALDTGLDAQLAQSRQYYGELYASYLDPSDPEALSRLQFYETVLFDPKGSETGGVDLRNTVDGSLWIALMAPSSDKRSDAVLQARKAIAGKTISLGIVPMIEDPQQVLAPGRQASAEARSLLEYYLPAVPESGSLPADRVPRYTLLPAGSSTDVLVEPGIVQITLPSEDKQLLLWNNLDPLEAGVRDLPPALEDSATEARLITWLRVRAASGVQARLLWAGINAATVSQRAHVSAELLGEGNGEPDQTATLSRAPVIPGSVRLTVNPKGDAAQTWDPIDDLLSAGPEVPTPDLRLPPGQRQAPNPRVNVFALDAEAGLLRFGDGLRGRRPPLGATLHADYDYGVGQAGNVGAGGINKGPALPAGIKIVNPVRTWGGADAETVAEGEKQIARYLQHRDRLVSAEDFAAIARRTPGVEIGRVEVLPAYHPDWSVTPGDAAGAVTLLLLPSYDPLHPDAPAPDRTFLNNVCAYLDPRRLVTTEVFLRGPHYRPLWISVGIDVVAGYSIAQVREGVRQALLGHLSPYAWPLRKPVIDRELLAVASRVEGVLMVNQLVLATGASAATGQVAMDRLQLPQVRGVSVTVGDAADIDQIRGQRELQPTTGDDRFVSVPVIPDQCL